MRGVYIDTSNFSNIEEFLEELNSGSYDVIIIGDEDVDKALELKKELEKSKSDATIKVFNFSFIPVNIPESYKPMGVLWLCSQIGIRKLKVFSQNESFRTILNKQNIIGIIF